MCRKWAQACVWLCVYTCDPRHKSNILISPAHAQHYPMVEALQNFTNTHTHTHQTTIAYVWVYVWVYDFTVSQNAGNRQIYIGEHIVPAKPSWQLSGSCGCHSCWMCNGCVSLFSFFQHVNGIRRQLTVADIFKLTIG